MKRGALLLALAAAACRGETGAVSQSAGAQSAHAQSAGAQSAGAKWERERESAGAQWERLRQSADAQSAHAQSADAQSAHAQSGGVQRAEARSGGADGGGAEIERCEGLRADPQRPGHHLARCDGRDVLLVLALREDPQRFRPSVGLWRLAQALGLRVVPRTEARALRLRVLLDAMSDEAQRQQLGRELAVEANGRVMAALIELPTGTRQRATRWSHEEKLWSGLAESIAPLDADQQALAEDWIAVLMLDYLSANLTRLAAEQDEQGRLWLVDNRSAFIEHPEQFATDQILARLKRARRYSPALIASLRALDDRRLDEALRPGVYEQWLVYPRPRREVAIRARALSTWMQATGLAPQ